MLSNAILFMLIAVTITSPIFIIPRQWNITDLPASYQEPTMQILQQCPLDLCRGVQQKLTTVRGSDVFLFCSKKRQFCGYCPMRTFSKLPLQCTAQSLENNLPCSLELCREIQHRNSAIWLKKNKTNFIFCSAAISFCGFCPPETYFHSKKHTCISKYQTAMLDDYANDNITEEVEEEIIEEEDKAKEKEDEDEEEEKKEEPLTPTDFNVVKSLLLLRNEKSKSCVQICLQKTNRSLGTCLRQCQF
ncbi:hypothetical protein T4B_4171 [Trichinella pseudospiralis]|uniref:ShKT domain-containing protein n=2 Tax=Trichinella pseudospiralis TaxID=6337 RepID=A0A0V1EC42_TRIPS|nr:hypothetical protein T4E_8369 [Trichinella pseudospiralis]KRY71389.1 hypothetical protein T4A_1361 [Trichinella pseudospiralis]KRY89206.1 hypothetical protein T4D_6046 [Trichinella pseudospiralis]KRZ20174.1 hypothetical protein T4B_4171 [Trichinella pseudospiralis]KRZ36472.1 hypothetical protein T4C_1362 [Trichinella pseudospiralis]